MKIELILHKENGEIRRYPVYRMDRQDGIWTARSDYPERDARKPESDDR